MVQGRGDQRRQELLEAALRVVGTRGVKAVSHRSVAAMARVPLGSTTYYFTSKEEILTETLRLAARTEIEALQRQVERLDAATMSAEEWVDALLDWLDHQLRGRARFRLVALYTLQLEATHRPELRAIYEEWTLATVRLARELLRDAGATAPDTTAPLLVAAIDGLRHNQLAVRDAGLSHSTARPIVQQLVHQLALGRTGVPASP